MFNPGTGFTQFHNNGTGESTIQGDLVGNVTGDVTGNINITDKQITFTGDTSSGVSSTTTRTVKKCILSGTLPSSSPFIIKSAQSGISSSSYVISSELMALADSGSPEVWYHFNNGSSSFLSFIRTGVDAGEIQVTFPTFCSGLSFILIVEYY